MARSVVFVGALACALLVGALTPRAACALEPPVHKNWTLGIGFGMGWSRLDQTEMGSLYSEDGISPRILFQHRVSDRMRAGVALEQWLIERGDGETRIRRSMQNFNASVTLVPGPLDNAWSGFYLRGGAGIAFGRYSEADQDEKGEDINLRKQDQTGFGAHAGVGYEFHVTQNFNAGTQFVYNAAWYDDAVFDHGWWAPLGITLNWTF